MDTPLPTDAELVTAARRGSPAAEAELVRRHQRQACLLAAAVVHDAAEAEDLAQEAFVRAFRNLHVLADPARFGPWLRRIVFGVSIDWLRTFRPELYRGWTDAAEDPDPADDAASPLERMLKAELSERVAAALAILPPRYSVPLRLFHLDGLSHAKVAEALDLPVGTVRSLVSRARRRLALQLADYAPEAAAMDEVFHAQHMPDTPPRPRFLHIANGSATTDLIARAGIPGDTSIWADPLHEGPVPGAIDYRELCAVRARHIARTPDDAPYEEVLADLTAWEDAIARSAVCDELVLWFEHDLFDQLNLIHLLDRIAASPVKAPLVSLICIGAFPGRTVFKGLGELTPDEIASLLETRQPVGHAQYSTARRAWSAFRAAAPTEIPSLLREDLDALPYLAAALGRHLEEFPSTRDGLSRTERRLLDLASGGPIDLWKAFPQMHDGEDAFFIGDMSFLGVARELAALTPPLLAIDEPAIQTTADGMAILNGRADRVALCGIDKWLGGTHLEGRGPVWRWDPVGGQVCRA